MNNKWINSTLNSEAYSSFEGVSSDHRIITAMICLSLHSNKEQTDKTTYLKHILQMTNMRIMSLPTWKQHQSAYKPNQERNVEFHGSH